MPSSDGRGEGGGPDPCPPVLGIDGRGEGGGPTTCPPVLGCMGKVGLQSCKEGSTGVLMGDLGFSVEAGFDKNRSSWGLEVEVRAGDSSVDLYLSSVDLCWASAPGLIASIQLALSTYVVHRVVMRERRGEVNYVVTRHTYTDFTLHTERADTSNSLHYRGAELMGFCLG